MINIICKGKVIDTVASIDPIYRNHDTVRLMVYDAFSMDHVFGILENDNILVDNIEYSDIMNIRVC
jgi:hypothetical protein